MCKWLNICILKQCLIAWIPVASYIHDIGYEMEWLVSMCTLPWAILWLADLGLLSDLPFVHGVQKSHLCFCYKIKDVRSIMHILIEHIILQSTWSEYTVVGWLLLTKLDVKCQASDNFSDMLHYLATAVTKIHLISNSGHKFLANGMGLFMLLVHVDGDYCVLIWIEVLIQSGREKTVKSSFWQPSQFWLHVTCLVCATFTMYNVRNQMMYTHGICIPLALWYPG